jgi:hypothetical protein
VRGKTRTEKVTGTGDVLRVQHEGGTGHARIRLAATDAVVGVAKGCRDKSAAASRMAELVREQERIRGGVITQRETNTAKHGHRVFADTVTAFNQNMTARMLQRLCKKVESVAAGGQYGNGLVHLARHEPGGL